MDQEMDITISDSRLGWVDHTIAVNILSSAMLARLVRSRTYVDITDMGVRRATATRERAQLLFQKAEIGDLVNLTTLQDDSREVAFIEKWRKVSLDHWFMYRSWSVEDAELEMMEFGQSESGE